MGSRIKMVLKEKEAESVEPVFIMAGENRMEDLDMSTDYGYNSQYLLRDGLPWFPVMGEMHYSRYNEELWEESLYKIRAGGVSIVSTYIFWIHHEEEKGIFDFSGCRDLRRFVELCGRVGLKVFLRLGPWAHGECRNGGFPDWVIGLGKEGVRLRSDDEVYLSYVRKFWEQIFRQVKGLMDADGGPVIGVQLENEYGHVGGLRGNEGEAHMRTLMTMAKEIGFCVPLYTATGWGGACIGDALPVMGGYCEAPWDRSTGELSANTNYIISHVRNDALIACDHHVEGAVTFDESKFPYLTAELGGGIQVTSHRRPVAEGRDIGAMSTTKLASGVALLGYYMYHGGSNPKGKFSTLQESRATGYANDLPEINYDFNAPIRQYGTISDTCREIKLLAGFLKDFGSDLATLTASIDPENVKPEDMHTLRKSCRHDGTHGYVFFNNYQRRRTMDAHKHVVFKGITDQGEISFPPVDVESGQYGFFPYNMRLGEAVLISALATPYCVLKDGDGRNALLGKTEKGHVGNASGSTYVFYGDYEPAYSWKGDVRADILHLSRAQALNAWKVTLERDYLIISDNYVWEQDGKLVVTGGAVTRILAWPKLQELPEGFVKKGMEGRMHIYERKVECEPAEAVFTKVGEDEETAVYEITINYHCEKDVCGTKGQGIPTVSRERLSGRDTLLWLAYAGFGMEIYCGGEKINDHFYTGQQVPLSLGYFGFPGKLTVKVHALHKNTEIFLEKWPQMEADRACRLETVTVTEEFRSQKVDVMSAL